MDSVPSLRRKSTSVRSTDTVDLTVQRRKSLTGSLSRHSSKASLRTTSSVLSVKKTLSIPKPAKLRKNPTRDRRPPKLKTAGSDAAVAVKKAVKLNDSDVRKSKLKFLRLAYLSVRNDEDSYFLCRSLQNVYALTKKFRVHWMNFDPETETYCRGYADDISPDSVLTVVHMTYAGLRRCKLREDDRKETERLLSKSVKRDKGLVVSDEESDDEEEEPPVKKKKAEKTKAGKKGKKEKKERQPRAKKEPKEKAPRKRKVSKKNEDLELHPNPNIKVLEKDPFFETKEKVPFVSKYVQGKLAIRAVLQNDMKLLKKLAQDKDKIFDLSSQRCYANPLTAADYAIRTNNMAAMKIFRDMENDVGYYNSRHRDKIMINRIGTGSYNPRSLGVGFIREIMASRGTREGNNALIKDEDDMTECRMPNAKDKLESAIEAGCDWELVQKLVFQYYLNSDNNNVDLKDISSYRCKELCKQIKTALEKGHWKIAGPLIKWAAGHSSSGYINLHAEVLLGEGEALKKVNPGHAIVHAKVLPGCTPIHCAALNPNPMYLKQLLAASPDINCNDATQKSVVHYAATCEGTGPLKLLLEMGASTLDIDREKSTALHMACKAGRAQNVEILLTSNPDLKSVQGERIAEQYGKGGINRSNKAGYQPIHLAVEDGYLDVVKVLLKHGAYINAELSISKFRLTPLMIATSMGYYDLVKFLVDSGAVVKQRDRLGRTALIHAVMNGHTHIASYLLHLGANPNTADSSNNTTVHYAAAYGWPHTTQLLLEAGADPNTQNLWKMSPLSIAWMKGHKGIVTILLEDDRVDVNFRDDKGQTLVHIAASSPIAADLYDQMVYLIEEKGGDASVVTTEGETALSLLPFSEPDDSEENLDASVLDERRKKIAELLLEHGCPLDVANKKGEKTLDRVIKSDNVSLCTFLVEKGATISEEADDDGNNLLHHMSRAFICKDMTDILQMLLKKKPSKGSDTGVDFLKSFKAMANQRNNQGFTPLLLACQKFARSDISSSYKDPVMWWRKKRKFIKLLVEELDADVNSTVGMLQFDGELPEKEKDRYCREGKMSVVDFLLNAKDPADPDGPTGQYPALTLMLKYHADLNTRSIDGTTPLCKAIRKRQHALVAHLLEHGVDCNMPETNESGTIIMFPLILAAKEIAQDGVVQTVKLLLKKGANINEKLPQTGYTVLHTVVNFTDVERRVGLVKVLLASGADVDACDNEKRTPLHLAVDRNTGSINASNFVEEMLIDHGADVFAKDKDSRMPISYVFSKINKDNDKHQIDPTEVCRLLATAMDFKHLDHKDNAGRTVLHRAAFRGAYLSCVYLLQKAPYLKVSTGDKTGTTSLGYALQNNYDNCACMLIQHEPAAVSKPIVTLPNTPFAEETSPPSSSDSESSESNFSNSDSDSDSSSRGTYGQRGTIRTKKKTRNTKAVEIKQDENKLKPLWIWKPLKKEEKVAKADTTSIFQAAINKELQGSAFTILELPQAISNLTNFRAIEIAMGSGKLWVALRLLSRIRDKTEFKLTNENGQNFFHIIALTCDSSTSQECFNMTSSILLEHDVPVDKKDKYGCTPIFYAALRHNFTLAKFFLKNTKKLDARIKDKFGRTTVAATLFNWDSAMNQEYEVGEFINSLFPHFAVLDDRFDFHPPQRLYGITLPADKKSYFTEGPKYRLSPLIQAVIAGSFTFAKYLLQSKASVNYTDSEGLYPILHAARQNDVKMVKLLLNHTYCPVEEQREIQREKEKKIEARRKELAKGKTKRNAFTLKRVATLASDESGSDMSEDEAPDDAEEDMEEDEDTPVYRAVTKTSKVNLNAQDKAGWSAVHHCVKPLTTGTYDNPEIVWVLAKAGASLSLKDKQGKTPLDLALECGADRIAKMIQDLLKVDQKKQKKPVPEKWDEIVDGLTWDFPPPDVEADSSALFKKLFAGKMDVDTPKLQEEIDDSCEIKETGELVMDDDLKRPYSALMTKVDIKYGSYGMYNFYKLQLVRQKGKDMYMLFTCWGRIGDTGQFQHTPFTCLEDGAKEFCKVYREKSGNLWANRNGEFESKFNKYRLVTLEEEHPGVKQDQIKTDLVSKVPSKLPPYLQEVIKEFTSVENLEASMRREVDSDLLPFGRLKKEDLFTAKKVLLEIGELLEKASEMAANFAECDKQEYWRVRDQVSRLSSQYYQLIPQKNFVFERIKPLDQRIIERQLRVVNNLLDYQKASQIILGAEFRKKEINPLDYVYRALNCKISLMDEEDDMTQYILRYISAAPGRSSVEAIYRLSRDGEEPCNLDNQKLLFHGSGVANYIGILNQGLLVAPPGVHISGSSYGQGIYSSHNFAKSRNYCCNFAFGSKVNYMLLCQVGLGKPDTSYRGGSGPRPGFDSVISDSHLRFGYEVKLPSGVTIPFGDSSRNYTEYIVYRPEQVVLRYLIQFRA